MKRIIIIYFIALFLCITAQHTQAQSYSVKEDSLNLFDKARSRQVPVELYMPETTKHIKHQGIVIINHGYNVNRPGSNKGYSFLANYLAAKGYFVASIQHELPTDDLIPDAGKPQIVRRPFWERGVQNILFVISELKKRYPDLDYEHLILQGHSNGGDMVMLFATKYPSQVDKAISFDNRRMAIPRVSHPRIYTIRSSDQPADEDVLPTEAEQKKYGITVIHQSHIIHNDMSDIGTPEQRKELLGYIERFLQNK